MVSIANEKAELRRQRAFARKNKAEVDEACRALLATPRGRKYLWWLLQIGKVGIQPFSANALTTSFACGELNVGQQVLAHILEVDPAGYVRMMQEQQDDYAKFSREPTDGTDDSADGADDATD